MLPVIQIGPLALQLPGLVLLVGLWLGLSLSERSAPRYGIRPDSLYNLVFIAMVSGLLGARLSYVVRYPMAFAASPLSLFSLNPGLLDPFGGLVTGLLAGTIYAQRKNLPFWPLLDALTPLLATLAVALGISHIASGNAYGAPTNLPWSIELWGEHRHPSQFYETLGALLILFAVWPGSGLIRQPVPGVTFLTFLAFSAGLHLFLEAFRGDSQVLFNGIRRIQVAAWLALVISLVALKKRVQTASPVPAQDKEVRTTSPT